MFPHIGINGSVGLASNQFRSVFQAKSWTGNLGPSLTWNILNYGRLLANVRFQNELYRQFVAEYQQAILNANQDAENSLIAYLRTLEQSEHLHISADAAANLTTYLIKQYQEGFLPAGAADTGAFINQMFTAVNFRVTQQDAAAQAEGNIALNLILLYRAMGGGWQIRQTVGHDGPHQGQQPRLVANTPPDVRAGMRSEGTTDRSPSDPVQAGPPPLPADAAERQTKELSVRVP